MDARPRAHGLLSILLACALIGGGFGVARAHPLDGLARLWDRGSFDSPGESLRWHFEKHGREVAAPDVETYARQAEGLHRQVRDDRWTAGAPVPGETPEVRRFVRGPRYIDLYRTSSNDRLIISFGAR